MREFTVIDAAVSVEQLRMRLKSSELEQYGEAFIPEFVYEVIRRLPRFSTMRVSPVNPYPYSEQLLTHTSEDTNKMPKSFLDFSWRKCMTNAAGL